MWSGSSGQDNEVDIETPGQGRDIPQDRQCSRGQKAKNEGNWIVPESEVVVAAEGVLDIIRFELEKVLDIFGEHFGLEEKQRLEYLIEGEGVRGEEC